MMTRRTALAAIAAVPALRLSGTASAQSAPTAHVFNILPIKPDALAAFLPVMQANAKASRNEAGNISFDVFQNEEGGHSLFLFEGWKSRDAHNIHMTLPHLKAVEQKAATDFAGTPTSVWVADVPGLPGHLRKPVPAAATTRNVIVRLWVKPEGRAAFVQGFAEVIPQSRAAPGNYAFDLFQEADNPNGFVLFERWKDKASHEQHLGQAYSKKLDGILPATLSRTPERYLLRDVVA